MAKASGFHPPEWWLSWRAWWTANLPFWAQDGQNTSTSNFGTRRTCVPYWSKTTGIRTACAHASTVRQYQKNILSPRRREEGSSGHSWWHGQSPDRGSRDWQWGLTTSWSFLLTAPPTTPFLSLGEQIQAWPPSFPQQNKATAATGTTLWNLLCECGLGVRGKEVKWRLTWACLRSHQSISAFQQHGNTLLLNAWATQKKEHMLNCNILASPVYRQRHRTHKSQPPPRFAAPANCHLRSHLNMPLLMTGGVKPQLNFSNSAENTKASQGLAALANELKKKKWHRGDDKRELPRGHTSRGRQRDTARCGGQILVQESTRQLVSHPDSLGLLPSLQKTKAWLSYTH